MIKRKLRDRYTDIGLASKEVKIEATVEKKKNGKRTKKTYSTTQLEK